MLRRNFCKPGEPQTPEKIEQRIKEKTAELKILQDEYEALTNDLRYGINLH